MPHLTECNPRLEKVSKLPGASPLPHFWVSLEPRRPPCTSFGRARPAPGCRSVDSLGSVRNPLPSDVLTLAPSAPSVSTHRSSHQKGLPRRAVLNTSTLTSRAGSLALHRFPSWNFTALLSVVCVRFGVRVFVHTRIVHIFVYACVTDHCRSSPRRR